MKDLIMVFLPACPQSSLASDIALCIVLSNALELCSNKDDNHLACRWGQYAPPKHGYISPTLYGSVSQKAVIFTLVAVRT